MYYVGIDLGTSAVKLLMMDIDGGIIEVISKEYPLYMDDKGWSEQEPNDWWEKVKEALKELSSKYDVQKIKSISFSGQMHGLVTLDENDNVIRRAILWNDQRTVPQCDYLNNVIGTSKLLDNVANIALTGFTLPKILWMKENEPELYSKISKIMLPKDYIAYKLCDVFATDYSDASGMLLLDVKNKCYSKFILDLLNINENNLPKLYRSYDCIGTISEKAAKETGLSTATKIIIGGGDQAVGAVGTGTVTNNTCSISLGTSGVVFVASDNCQIDYEKSAIHSFCHATGNYHMMGVTLAAAASNKWWADEILKETDYSKTQENIVDIEKNKIYFLPYLTGERTPINDPDARGVFLGMTSNTKREDMTLAVLEGVAFSLRQILERINDLGVKVSKVRIIGGGAKSTLWKQIISDVLNVSVESINATEGPAFGAAILAATGDDQFESLEDATNKLIKITSTISPNSNLLNHYDKKYNIYKKLYKNLENIFKEI